MSTETKTGNGALNAVGRVGVHGVDSGDKARCMALVEVSGGAHERLKAIAKAMSGDDARFSPVEVLRLLLSQYLLDLEYGEVGGTLSVIDNVCAYASEFDGVKRDSEAVAEKIGPGLKPRGGETGKRK